MHIKKFYVLLLLVFTFFTQNAWGQLFEQNFNSSSTASDYVNSSSPNNGQFTQITATSGSSASATGNKLNFTRSTGGSSNFVRSVGFSPAPSALMIRFDISVSSNSTAKSGQGVFYLGTSTGVNAFGNDNVAPSNANSHSRLGISWTTTAGQFAIRKMKSAAADGPNLYTGTQTVIWVVNNSGSTLNYRAPNGSNSSVANDKFDVWVGTTLEFDELDAETSGVTGIDKIKFVSLGENGTISIDNILIDPIPVAVTSGTASNITSSGFRANWTAVSGVTGYRVDVSTANDFSSFVSGYNNLYVSGQSTNYLDISGLNSSTQYYYRVRAASQYTVDEFAGANSSSQSATTSSSGSTPPTLSAAGSATVDAAFDVTFTDDATWRAAITGITIGGTPLTAGWSASSGKITFTPSASTPAGLLQTAGSKSIVVAATGYSDATVTQSIGFGAATKLGITQQPTAPASNGAVLAQQPVVVIQDQYGNTVTSSSATVTAAVGSGTWTIGGTTNPSASSGVATFTGLTATSAAAVTGATINFSSSGLTGITSNTFNIPAPAPANDLCGSAVALTIDAVATSGTLTAATYTAFTNASNKNDVWYSFTPACSGKNTITVTFSSGPDLDFQVFSNSNACPINNSQSVATSQSSNATDETYNSYTFLKGVTYYIRVYEYADVASDFTIQVTSPTPAAQAVTTNAADNISATGARLNGQISTVGVCPTSNGKGFVYAETATNNNPVHGGTGVTTVPISSNTIPQNLSAYNNTPSLSAATQYSYKAYVLDEDGNYTYGSVETFTTLATEPADNPTTSAVRNSSNPTSAIDVSWTSVTADGYIVMRRSGGQPTGIPVDATIYNVNDDIGDSKVVYIGTGTNFTDGSLTPGTEYRYRVYPYNGTGAATNYRTATADTGTAYTLALEPTTHAASFTAMATTSTNIALEFSEANTITNATGYLILRKSSAFVAGDYPLDGQAYAVSAAVGSNGAVVNTIVTNDATTTASYGASADQTWYFLLVPYNQQGAVTATRNYNINPTIPTSNTTTPSGASDAVAVASSSPATISSIINDAAPLTSSTGVQVWQITIRDGGAGMNDADLLPTKVSGITFTAAGGNGVTWNTAIKTAALFNGSTFIATASSITATNIVFSGLSISVADNSSATYSLRISLNETLGTGNDDGKYFIFQLSQGNITTVADGTSSNTFNFTAITTASGGTENKIDVVATKLAFAQQPTDGTAFSDITPAVTVQATDANGNIDLDFTAAVAITATGSVLRNSPVSQSSVSGLATFSDLQFVKAGTGITLTAASGALTTATSNGFTITLGSPIVALAQWTFETSAPTTAGPHSPEIGSGQATGYHASASTVYSSPAGNGSSKSFSSNYWASGDYYQFKTSSIGYQNITLSFDQTGSNTGPRDFKIQYSTDGSTFTDFSGGTYQLTNDSWTLGGDYIPASSRSFDLSSVTALNNKANIYIRFTVSSSTAINGSGIQTAGTGRVDNVIIKGTPITFTWNGAGDGINWNDAANWDCNCGITPTINNPVVIPNSANVVLNTDYTARNLQLQATSSLKIAPNKTLTVEGYADFNNQHVTVQSTASGTGMIGQVSGFIEDANNVTVERYISASGNRAYRLLTPSVTTTNYIRDNWQEGTNNADEATNSNPNPGYGTHITGVGGASNGFDPTQNNQSSLYKLVSNAWVAVTNTNATILEADKAYLLFVRGSRDNINTINTLTGSSNTTLRATGTIKQGAQSFTSLPASSFNLITNPYAAPLDWSAVYAANNSNFENYVHIWDPNIGTRGGYVAVEDNGTTSVASDLTEKIQSGQAFFVRTKSSIANLNIIEANKATINNLNVFKTATNIEKLQVQLRFNKDNKDILADGVLAKFDSAYSNEIDSKDALQITNWDEDIALTRGSSKLSIESRSTISSADTLFLRIANLKVSQGVYYWVMAPTNFTNKNFQAYLEDDFTGSRKPISLNDTTKIEFNVTNNAASTAFNRFRIVFAERKLYYSKANNLHADDLNSWSSTTDGNGTSPTSFNELANYTIQQGHTLQLNGTLNLTEGVLTIQPNAGINNAGLLTVAYNVENNGAINGEGVLQLNGLIKQYLTGNGNYSKLELNNNAGAEIQIENNAFITDAYIPTTGILKTHNNLILKSTALKTASISIGNTTGNYINGSIKVERYIPAKATRKWSFITSPLTQSIANGWQQQIHITGAGVGGSVCPIPTTHSNGFDATLTNASNIYTYNAANTSGQRWVSLASTISDFTNAGQAFRVNIRGDRNLGCNLLDGTITSPNEVTLVSSGLLNNEAKNAGNFDIAFNNNGINNYIFIGNPYPSAINFSLLQSTNSAVIQNNYAIYIPENNAGIYTYWDGYTNTYTGGIGYNNLVGNSIASGQSVFVQSAVAGNVVLHFEENIKSEENSVGYFKNNLLKNKIKINYLNSAGIKIDEAIIRYLDEENVNNTSIGKLDIPSINSGTFISSLKNNTSIAVHSRLLSTLTKDEVWLNIGATQSGNYTLNFSEFNEFTDADIYLIDHLTNTTQNIKQNASYNFSVDVNHIATKGSNRFSLVFTKKIVEPTIVYNNIKIYPNPANSTANLLLPENSSYTITILDLYGKNIKQIHSKGGVCKINVSLLSAGTYIVEILDDKGKKTVEKLIKTSN